jgi:predicted metal-dependent hydrolase
MSIQIDEIIRSKRKSIALLITSDGRLVIKAPLKTTQKYIDELVDKKSRWIEAKLMVVQNRNLLHQPKQYIEGEDFLLLGEKYQLAFCDGIKEICINSDCLLIPQKFQNNINQKLQAWYKQQAKKVFGERLTYFSKITGIKYKAMKITDAQKRWGSCGTNLIINFAWRSVMAPLDVVDYLVVHELCHIVHHNHSKAYWTKVASIMLDFRDREKWLKTNQSILSAV